MTHEKNQPEANGQENLTREHPSGEGAILGRLRLDFSLHRTPDGRGFISFMDEGKRTNDLVHSMVSRQKIKYIAKKVKEEIRNQHALKVILDELEEMAVTEGTEATLDSRIRHKRGSTFLNLCHPDGKIVRISPRKVEEVYATPNDIFLCRFPGMSALPNPSPGGSVDLLRRFLNVKDERSWRLILVIILSYLSGIGPFVCTILVGEQGTAKSTISKIIRALVDPNAAPLQAIPRSERDLAILAMSSYLLTFDNVSDIPKWLSDALCRILTGGGLATRSLYNDDRLRIFFSMNPVLINCITEAIQRSDLLDRSVPIFLRPISDFERKSEAEFWQEFELEKAKIFSALLEKVAQALAILPFVRTKGLPRMADFAKFGIAVEEAMGWDSGTFLSDYYYMKSFQDSAVLENFPCYRAIKKIAEEGWEDNASSLLTAITDIENDSRLINSKYWPKSAAKLSADLNRYAPNFRKEGIEINCNCRTAGSNSTRYISIKRVRKEAPNGS